MTTALEMDSRGSDQNNHHYSGDSHSQCSASEMQATESRT